MPKLEFYIGVDGQNNVCIIKILLCGMSSLLHRHSYGFGTRSFPTQSPSTAAWEAIA